MKTCDERSTFAISIRFFLNICFHDFSVENYLILYAKQNKLGSESSVSCLKQDSKMSNFCLKQGRGLKASAAHLYPNFPTVPSGIWVVEWIWSLVVWDAIKGGEVHWQSPTWSRVNPGIYLTSLDMLMNTIGRFGGDVAVHIWKIGLSECKVISLIVSYRRCWHGKVSCCHRAALRRGNTHALWCGGVLKFQFRRVNCVDVISKFLIVNA